MKIIAAYNIKGGVGKTSAAVNMAWSASQQHRTLLWDLDPQGAATYLLRVKPKVKGGAHGLVGGKEDLADAVRPSDYERLAVIPADLSYGALDLELDATKNPRRRLERMLSPLAKYYDVVILDCPPGMSLLSESILTAADLIVVPLVPSPLSMRTLDQVTRLVVNTERRPPKILGFLSMVDRRKTIHRDLADRLPKELRHVLPVVVPYSTMVERMGVERAPIAEVAPRSEAARAYAGLWEGVSAALSL